MTTEDKKMIALLTSLGIDISKMDINGWLKETRGVITAEELREMFETCDVCRTKLCQEVH